MRYTRIGIVRALALWTLLALVLGIAIAVQAALSLNDDQQACFFNYPAVPCPGGDARAVGRLTFAFLGVPLIWFAGLLVGSAWRALTRRKRHVP